MAKARFNAPKLHWSLTDSTQRLIESIAPILQIIAAAMVGYLFSKYVLGHEVPLLSVTVAITSLGFTRDARPRRVVETAFGMLVGIAISEFILVGLGQGVLQMGLTLLICLTLARFISASAAFAITVGIQAMLVHWLPAPDGGVFIRLLDGLIGGTTALVFTALIPRDPRRLAKRDAGRLFGVFLESLNALKIALREVNVEVVDQALIQVRRSQPLIDNWRLSLDSAIAIARISPFLRKYQDALQGQVRLMRGMDLATRNLRVVVRRVDFLVRDGQARPYLAELIEQIEQATLALGKSIDEPEWAYEAREQFVEIIHQLDPKKFGIADQIREASVLLLLRPMLIDLLCASGMREEDARAELPEI